MHELSLCRNIIKTIEAYNTNPLTGQIRYVYLEIGMLAVVDKAALQFNFSILKRNTCLKDATLIFIDIPGEAFCELCQKNVKIVSYQESCLDCGQFMSTITKGLELRIHSLEMA